MWVGWFWLDGGACEGVEGICVEEKKNVSFRVGVGMRREEGKWAGEKMRWCVGGGEEKMGM